jgi:hypothetical protein
VSRPSLLGVLVAVGVFACQESAPPPPVVPRAAAPDHPDSPLATWKRDPALNGCHAGVQPQENLLEGVTALAQACAGASRMHQIDQTVVGTKQAHETPFEIPVHVEADHCYRAYGMSSSSLLDLDVAFVDSAGRFAGGDATVGSIAVALEDGAVCFSQGEDAKVSVRSENGGGKFAVQVWAE